MNDDKILLCSISENNLPNLSDDDRRSCAQALFSKIELISHMKTSGVEFRQIDYTNGRPTSFAIVVVSWAIPFACATVKEYASAFIAGWLAASLHCSTKKKPRRRTTKKAP